MIDERKREGIERESVQKTAAEVALYLQKTLGQKITAYLSGLKDTKEVGQWVSGDVAPRQMAESRLRYAYVAVRLLSMAYDTMTAKSWLFGSNTRLNNEAPAYILRHAKSIDDIRFIVPAAQAFAGSFEGAHYNQTFGQPSLGPGKHRFPGRKSVD